MPVPCSSVCTPLHECFPPFLCRENELNDFINSANTLIENIQNDEFVTVLRFHAGLVADDLSYHDTEGRVQVDTEMLGKLRSVIAPILAETLKYIPVPRIEDSNDKRDYWVDNIILCGYDVIPNNLRFQIESDSNVSLRDIETQKSYTKMIITLKEIRTELKNMEFFYHKKTFPEMTEHGRVTLRLTGDGATLKMIFEIKQDLEDKVPKLEEGEVHFQIHKMDIEFDKGSLNHDILVPMLTTMMKNQIQLQIENEIESSLKILVKTIGDQLTASIVQINRPFMTGFDKVRGMIKETEVVQVNEKRKAKLE